MEYIVETAETGEQLISFTSFRAAERYIVEQEVLDRANGEYSPGYYAIRYGDMVDRITNPAWASVEEYESFTQRDQRMRMRVLGMARTPRKAAAVRENGKLGGRPRKAK